MNRAVTLLFTLLVAGCAASCVLPDDVAALQKDVQDVRQELARLRADQQASQKALDALRAQTGTGDAVKRAEFADAKIEIERVSRQVSQIDERIKETEGRLDRMGQDVVASRAVSRRLAAAPPTPPPDGAAPAVPPAPTGALPDPAALYNQAYADFSKGNFPLAISGFEEYLERFPDSDTADNALYWVGECYLSQGRHAAAVESFDRLLERYPKSDKAASADLKKALAWLETNQLQKAIVQFRHVMDTYPSTDEARVARDRLASLGTPAPPARSGN